MSKELLCFISSRRIRIEEARKQLRTLRKEKYPAILHGGAVRSRNGLWKKALQCAWLPLGFVLVFMLTPVDYLVYKREKKTRRRELLDELAKASKPIQYFEPPKEKSVYALWHLYGLDPYRYSLKARLRLLCEWLDILYGPDTAKELRIKRRVKALLLRQEQSLPHLLKDHKSAASLKPPVESLISRLDDELPPYEETD